MKRFNSIKKTGEYRAVYMGGSSSVAGCLIMYVMDNDLGFNRIGISASKKIGNSVVRHKFTRRIREIYRLNNSRTVQGKDIIVVARGSAGRTDYEKLEKYYLRLLGDHKLLLDDHLSEE